MYTELFSQQKRSTFHDDVSKYESRVMVLGIKWRLKNNFPQLVLGIGFNFIRKQKEFKFFYKNFWNSLQLRLRVYSKNIEISSFF